MAVKIKGFEMTKHFEMRFKQRFNGSFDDLIRNTKYICTRNSRALHICKSEKSVFSVHTNIDEKTLITLYEVDPKKFFRDFMRLYITKPQQLKHQFRNKKTWGSLFTRINNKLKHKLKKYANSLFVHELNTNSVKQELRFVFAQIVYDYLDFYLKYLSENFTKESFENYVLQNGIEIDRTENRERFTYEFLEDKFTDEQIIRFFE